MAFDSRHFLHYFRLTADNRLLFGGRAEFSGPTLESAKTRAKRSCSAPCLRRSRSSQRRRSSTPGADTSPLRATRCRMPAAWTTGFMPEATAGMASRWPRTWAGSIARRIAGEPIDHPFFDDHFDPIPLYYGRPWFLPLVGLYYRWLDWID